MNRVFVGIGSNIDPYNHIAKAIDRMARDHRLIRSSSLIKTAPLGFPEQPDFVNGAALVETDCNVEGFTRYLKSIEKRLGRVKTGNKNGPRTIDLDIVIWNGSVVDDDYYTRDFLRNSIAEIGGKDDMASASRTD